MRKFIEPFVVAPIVTQQTEEDMIHYYDAAGQLLAEVYEEDGQFCSATFYGESEQPSITREQAVAIAEHVQVIFQQDQLQLQSVEQDEDGFLVEFKRVEPVYGMTVQGIGLFVTVSNTGFVECVTLHDNEVNICYPAEIISKEQARAILQQQPILQLGIAPELGWQYAYKPNYDLFGVNPDGKVRLWSEDESMQDASFEPLSQVEAIADFDAFIKGGRNVTIEAFESEEEKRWVMDTEEEIYVEEKAFIRACQVVKHLVGKAYEHYFVEQYPTLRKLLHMDEHAFVTFRFVYIFEGISFDFQAISISVNTETNQIEAVHFPFIPYENLPDLPKPTLTLEQANDIASQLIDVELLLENDLIDEKKRSFVYNIDYPTSPTGAHIQYVDAFTGEIHWIDNR